MKLFEICPVVFPFKDKGFPRKSLYFLCGCASAMLAKISSLLYREFFQHNQLKLTEPPTHREIGNFLYFCTPQGLQKT